MSPLTRPRPSTSPTTPSTAPIRHGRFPRSHAAGGDTTPGTVAAPSARQARGATTRSSGSNSIISPVSAANPASAPPARRPARPSHAPRAARPSRPVVAAISTARLWASPRKTSRPSSGTESTSRRGAVASAKRPGPVPSSGRSTTASSPASQVASLGCERGSSPCRPPVGTSESPSPSPIAATTPATVAHRRARAWTVTNQVPATSTASTPRRAPESCTAPARKPARRRGTNGCRARPAQSRASQVAPAHNDARSAGESSRPNASPFAGVSPRTPRSVETWSQRERGVDRGAAEQRDPQHRGGSARAEPGERPEADAGGEEEKPVAGEVVAEEGHLRLTGEDRGERSDAEEGGAGDRRVVPASGEHGQAEQARAEHGEQERGPQRHRGQLHTGAPRDAEQEGERAERDRRGPGQGHRPAEDHRRRLDRGRGRRGALGEGEGHGIRSGTDAKRGARRLPASTSLRLTEDQVQLLGAVLFLVTDEPLTV